ncbi:hypothetical protein T09_8130 [Trichinella sp. T9]|nr:hypothetical protein T09_8130 [Trichinella sp. T9]
MYTFGNIVHCSVCYYDIGLLMIYWETYLVKPFATLNTDFCSFFCELCNDPAYLNAGNVHVSLANCLANGYVQISLRLGLKIYSGFAHMG